MSVIKQENQACLYTSLQKIVLNNYYFVVLKYLHVLLQHFYNVKCNSPFSLISVLYNLQVRFCDRNDIYTYCGEFYKSYKFIFTLKYLRAYNL